MPLSPGTTEEMAASFTIKIAKRPRKDKPFVEYRRNIAPTAIMSDIRKYNTQCCAKGISFFENGVTMGSP
jgi:hypothetical protein